MRVLTVFYSWQSDLPEKTNRYFILKCLNSAAKKLNQDLLVEDAERDYIVDFNEVKIEHDTAGLPGTPDILSAILERIAACDIFVADVSFVGQSFNCSRLLPNPNVMLELGHAFSVRKSDQIFLVLDIKHGGAKPEERPFDIRSKRAPILFDSSADVAAQEKILTNTFKTAIRDLIRSGYTGATDLARLLSVRFGDSAVSPVLAFEQPDPATQSKGEAEATLRQIKDSEKPPKPGTMGAQMEFSSMMNSVSSSAYEAYIVELERSIDRVVHTVKLDLSILNDSQVLVEDCDVLITVPESLMLLSGLPKCPRDPKSNDYTQIFRGIHTSIQQPGSGKSETIDGRTWSVKIATLKHGLPVSLPTIFVLVLGSEKEFNLSYKLVCAKPHETVEGSLSFSVR